MNAALGVGLAALLSGAHAYYALDVARYSHPQRDLAILAEVVELFRRRAPIPGEDEFPRVRPRLDSYEFPSHILTDDRLNDFLKEERLEAIRRAIVSPAGTKAATGRHDDTADIILAYVVPWTDPAVLDARSVDMIVS